MDKIPVIARSSYFLELITQCRLLKQYNDSYESSSTSTIASIQNEIQSILNNIFRTKECTEVLYTENFGNQPFGIFVLPVIHDSYIKYILYTDIQVLLKEYSIEIDSNVVTLLEAEELASYIVEEIYGITSPYIVENLRSILDLTIYGHDYDITCKDFTFEKKKIIKFGMHDIIQKLGSLTTKDLSKIGNNVYSKAFDIDDTINTVVTKLQSSIFLSIETEIPKNEVMDMVMYIVKNFETKCTDMITTLENTKQFISSTLMKDMIERTIKALSKHYEKVSESSIALDPDIVYEGVPFFTKLKKNGLRQIEDDLYEFKVRCKNCEVQDDAIYIMRQINSRLAILDDYVTNANLSDYERDKYLDLIYKFRNLREDIGKKTIRYKKNYGIFVDYDKLDAMDM